MPPFRTGNKKKEGFQIQKKEKSELYGIVRFPKTRLQTVDFRLIKK